MAIIEYKAINCDYSVRCTCGEDVEFYNCGDGWQHIQECYCGLRVSIQVDEPIAQVLSERAS